MNEQKKYRDDLLEWCHTVELKWDRLKPRFSKLVDNESLEEWEGSCRQLKEKLQADIKADFDDYEKAISLYDQLDLLYRESKPDQEEMDVDSVLRLEIEEQIQIEEESMETVAFQDEMEVEVEEQNIDTGELKQYRKDLLEWCDNLYANWNNMKPRFSKLVDDESLQEWEGLCCQLRDKLQEDLTADFDAYRIANGLFEQWEKLMEESYALEEEIEVDVK